MPKKKTLDEIIPLRVDPATEANVDAIIASGLAADRSAALRAGAAIAARFIAGQEDPMRTKDPDAVVYEEGQLDLVAGMRERELDMLEDAIAVRRNQLMAARLESRGFRTRTTIGQDDDEAPLRYVIVYDPGSADGLPAIWADAGECRRLLDFVANLEPAEAFRRWAPTVTPLAEPEPYTEAEARADIRRERQELRAQYQRGEIDGEAFREGYREARSYTDYVEKE